MRSYHLHSAFVGPDTDAFSETSVIWRLSIIFMMSFMVMIFNGFCAITLEWMVGNKVWPEYIRFVYALCEGFIILAVLYLLREWRSRIEQGERFRLRTIPAGSIFIPVLLLFSLPLFVAHSPSIRKAMPFIYLAPSMVLFLGMLGENLRRHHFDPKGMLQQKGSIPVIAAVLLIHIVGGIAGIYRSPVRSWTRYLDITFLNWTVLCVIWLWWCEKASGRIRFVVIGLCSWALYFLAYYAVIQFSMALRNESVERGVVPFEGMQPEYVSEVIQRWLSVDHIRVQVESIAFIWCPALVMYAMYTVYRGLLTKSER